MPRYDADDAKAGCLFVLAFYSVYIVIWGALAGLLGIWTDRNLEFWCSHFSGHAVNVPFALSWAASLPLPLSFLLNVIFEIARQCM